MTPDIQALSQHLLTEEDLARLEVPPGDVAEWLATGSLLRVGSLGSEHGAGHAVYACVAPELHQEFASRLADLEKGEVLLSPERTRSVLRRAMGIWEGAVHLDGESEPAEGAADANALLASVRDEAHREAQERQALPPPDGGDHGDTGEFFDVADLTTELASWSGGDAPTPPIQDGEPAAPTAFETEPETENRPMTEADPEVDPKDDPVEGDVFAAFDTFEKPKQATRQSKAQPITDDVFAAFDAIEQSLAPPDGPLVEPEVAAALAAEADAPVPSGPGGDPAATPADTQEPGDGGAPAVEPWNEVPAVEEAAVASRSLERVESFLGELRGALLELAQRPQPQPVDMQPLVAAVGEFGQRVEHGVAIAVHAAMSSQQTLKPANGAPVATHFVQPPVTRNHAILLLVCVLLSCWAAIFWLKTGSINLALGTFVGANAVACCMLAGQRR